MWLGRDDLTVFVFCGRWMGGEWRRFQLKCLFYLLCLWQSMFKEDEKLFHFSEASTNNRSHKNCRKLGWKGHESMSFLLFKGRLDSPCCAPDRCFSKLFLEDLYRWRIQISHAQAISVLLCPFCLVEY